MRIEMLVGALVLAAVSAQADYQQAVQANNPIGYWRLNETNQPPPADVATNSGSLGTAAAGFYLGNTAHAMPGALTGSTDAAVAFDGVAGTLISVPASAALNPQPPFSVEFWVNPAAAMPDTATFTSPLASLRRVTPAAEGWIFYQTITGWNYRSGNTATGYTINMTGATTIAPGSWYHVVVTYDGTNAIMYVNSKQDATGLSDAYTPGYVPNTTIPLGIGCRGQADGYWFNGFVDEVAIYPKVLTSTEVLSHYQNGTSASPSTPYDQLVKAANPLGYYRLNEPIFTPPASFPVAKNVGSTGVAADGSYYSGSKPAAAGPRPPQFNGFEANNNACEFNGAAGYVGTPFSLNDMTKFTVMGWLKRSAVKTSRGGYFGQNDLLEFGDVNSGAGIEAWNASSGNIIVSYPFADDQWGLITLVGDGTQTVLYTNGAVAGTLTGTVTSYGASSYFFNIGGGGIFNATGDYFRGCIDEVAVFDQALSASQVQQIYYSANVAPTITSQPQAPAGTVFEGNTVKLTVVASGTPTLQYQWRKEGADLTAGTTAELTISNAQVSDSGNYDVVVRNDYGSVTSSIVALAISVANPPIITQQPQPSTRFVGGSAAFNVTATGSTPLAYQWKLNGTDLTGATASSFTLSSVKASDAGLYSVVVTNPVGATNSVDALLTVVTPTGYTAEALKDKPHAYWRLGETSGTVAADAWGGHDGQYSNVTLGQPGFSVSDADTAAGFSPANNSQVSISNAGPFNVVGATPSFSLEAWAKFASSPGIQRLFSNGLPGNYGIGFGVNGNNRLRFTTYGVQDMDSETFEPVLVVGKWYHLVCVVDTGVAQYYVNGNPIGSPIMFTGAAKTSAQPFQLGRNPLGAAEEEVDGLIDEAAFYTNALSPDRVLAHYQARYGNDTKPVFITQPQAFKVYVNRPASFTAVADGTEPISYQWKVNGANVPDAITESLTLTNTAGTHSVTVTATSPAGSTDSSAATLTVLPVPTSCNLAQDLVVHLKFDGDYLDVSGRNNHGTKMGSPTFISGKVGAQALQYSTDTGASVFNYVTLGNPVDLQFGTNVNFSVSFWTRFTGAPGDLPFLANNNNSMGDYGVTLAPSYNEGGWSWGLNDFETPAAWPGVGLYDPVKNTLNDGVWHHLTHTFDRQGNGTTYLDGVQVHSQSITSAAGWNLTTGRPWNIGQASGTYPETGAFDIDDIGIWRRVLTSLEVDNMYLAGQNSGLPLAPDMTAITLDRVGAQIRLTWPTGTLESADDLTGSFNTVSGASSPWLVTPDTARKFYRVRQ